MLNPALTDCDSATHHRKYLYILKYLYRDSDVQYDTAPFPQITKLQAISGVGSLPYQVISVDIKQGLSNVRYRLSTWTSWLSFEDNSLVRHL